MQNQWMISTISQPEQKRQLYRFAKPPKHTDEPVLFRKPPPDKTHSKTYELGPKALEDVFEVMWKDIANMSEKTKSYEEWQASTQGTHIQQWHHN